MSLCVYIVCADAHRGQRGCWIPWTLSYKSLWATLYWCGELNSGLLEEQQAVLIAEPSLQALTQYFYLWLWRSDEGKYRIWNQKGMFILSFHTTYSQSKMKRVFEIIYSFNKHWLPKYVTGLVQVLIVFSLEDTCWSDFQISVQRVVYGVGIWTS